MTGSEDAFNIILLILFIIGLLSVIQPQTWAKLLCIFADKEETK